MKHHQHSGESICHYQQQFQAFKRQKYLKFNKPTYMLITSHKLAMKSTAESIKFNSITSPRFYVRLGISYGIANNNNNKTTTTNKSSYCFDNIIFQQQQQQQHSSDWRIKTIFVNDYSAFDPSFQSLIVRIKIKNKQNSTFPL